MKQIAQFSGEYRFMSNFWPCEVELDGEVYQSVEAAYQAAKTLSPFLRKQVRECRAPGQAKRLGKELPLREDWEAVKVGVMYELLCQKFGMNDLARWLLGTGDAELVEGNTWGDTFWGVYNGEGKNHLGLLLMQIKNELRVCRVPVIKQGG